MNFNEYYLFVLIIPVLIFSMIIGIIVVTFLKKTKVYAYFNRKTFFINSRAYDLIGTQILKKMITGTPLKYFNQEIKIKNKSYTNNEIAELRKKMTDAEIGHIVGFILTLIICVALIILHQNKFAIVLLFILNIIFNFYPVLLQQSNKVRLDNILREKSEPFSK